MESCFVKKIKKFWFDEKNCFYSIVFVLIYGKWIKILWYIDIFDKCKCFDFVFVKYN